ncbi:hypothetical protein ACEV60_19965 [Enterobacter ludwigii]|uniref:phage tail fiber protein n=1 Tax=Enterobacter ludwigii TaxID=299767 RepID=UPI003BEED691
MQKIGSSTTTADENGEFTDGDPQTQVPCTWVMAAWLNTLQRELVHLCEEAGITIDPEDDTQVYQAIAQLLNTSTEGMVKTVNEHQPDEHGNVKLGSAADADVTTSHTDGTANRVLRVADFGLGGYGTFWRNDGTNLYLMLTNNGDPYGNYNNLRPLRVSVATGEAVMHKLNLEDFGYFDARYNAKYPAQFRVGARVTYNGSDFGSHVPQGAVNINNYTNGDDRINGVVYAYLQYNLNGNWVNFA